MYLWHKIHRFFHDHTHYLHLVHPDALDPNYHLVTSSPGQKPSNKLEMGTGLHWSEPVTSGTSQMRSQSALTKVIYAAKLSHLFSYQKPRRWKMMDEKQGRPMEGERRKPTLSYLSTPSSRSNPKLGTRISICRNSCCCVCDLDCFHFISFQSAVVLQFFLLNLSNIQTRWKPWPDSLLPRLSSALAPPWLGSALPPLSALPPSPSRYYTSYSIHIIFADDRGLGPSHFEIWLRNGEERVLWSLKWF